MFTILTTDGYDGGSNVTSSSHTGQQECTYSLPRFFARARRRAMLGKTPRGEVAAGAGAARENGEGSGKVEACKGVPPHQGWVHGKVFYVDKEECPGAEKIELRIKALGGQIEGFLDAEKSMRMHYIITREAALDRITGQNQGKKPDGGKYSSVGPLPAITCLQSAREAIPACPLGRSLRDWSNMQDITPLFMVQAQTRKERGM